MFKQMLGREKLILLVLDIDTVEGTLKFVVLDQ
jgi:hypothetical protein